MRVSLNLSEDIVRKVDSLVDGKKYRNRSHAVEKILSNAVNPDIGKKAVVLMGREQEGPHAATFSIDGEYLIEHTLSVLREAGVEEVLLIGSHFKEIKEIIGELNHIEVSYVEEEEPRGTAGALNLVKDRIKKPFIVMNGDIYVDFDIKSLIAFHSEEEALATLALGTTGKGSLGKVKVKGTDLLRFEERGELKTNLVSVGFYIFEPEIFNCIPEEGMIEEKVFPRLAKEGKVSGYLIGGKWEHLTKEEGIE